MTDDPHVAGPVDEPAAEPLDDGAEVVTITIKSPPQHRLDKYLQQRLKGSISRSQIQKLINLGGVAVNGKLAKASTTLRVGDVIRVVLPPPPVRGIVPEPLPLDILFVDEDLIVLYKQANLIVHPARGQLKGTLVNALAYHLQRQLDDRQLQRQQPTLDPEPGAAIRGLSSVGLEDYRPGVVHRLDRNTTGVMVVAKRDATHWLLARQFEERQTLKAYLALVHGSPDPATAAGGCIDEPIGKHPTQREAMAVRRDPSARNSVTLWRVRRRYRGYTLVELELKTGRTHQIRVHLSYLGCPIAGDILYGGEVISPAEIATPPIPAGHRRYLTFARPKDEGDAMEEKAAARGDVIMATPALHAAVLSFIHPGTHQRVRYTAPVPSPMLDLLRALEPHRVGGPVATDGTHVDLASALAGLTHRD